MRKLLLLRQCALAIFFISHQGKAEINVSSELNCDFSTPCMWRNATDDSGDWIISSHLDVDSTQSIIPMREGDDQPFAYTGGFMGRTQAILVSDVVNCQLGGANIKYWYYQTGMQSQLDVCIRQPPGNREPSALQCYDGISSTHGHQWIFRVIELPPISQPFEIIFRSTYYPPADVIAIDEILFESALCEINTEGGNAGAGGTFGDVLTPPPRLVDFNKGNNEIALSNDLNTRNEWESRKTLQDIAHRPVNYAAPTFEGTTTMQPSPRVGPHFIPMCPSVDCVFDQKTFCNYVTSESSRENATLRSWQLTERGVLNSVTGIPYDLSKNGSFVYAGGTSVNYEETYILSTNEPINILEESRLDFFIFLAGIHGRLRICLNTLTTCPLTIEGKNIDNSARQWKNQHIMLSPGTHAIHFIADRLRDNYVIGLDNIQVLNKFGNTAFAC